MELDQHLNTAILILLLISPDFLASDSCYEREMQRALQRHELGQAHVVPIILRPVDWKRSPFAHLQALPTDAKAITTWSNQDEAWVDVARGIRKILEELLKDERKKELLVSKTPQPVQSQKKSARPALFPPIWNVPFPQKQFFTGREALLKRLHTQLRTAQTAALGQAVSGLGGIGKTQLAVKYAYRHQQEYQAVLWAHAETTEALTTSYTEIARLLQLPQKDAKEQEEIVQGVKDWMSSQQNWLLILDNADEPDVLIPFLPPKVGGHLIVTTRAADLSNLGLGFGHALTVPKFTKQQDVPFLLRRAGRTQISSQDRKYARRIADELDGLPLALNQAGVYLATTGSSLASYWKLYQQQRATLLNVHKENDREYPRSVAATLLLSFGRVEQRNPAAADLLRLCAFLAPDAIPEALLTKGARELGDVLAPVAADVYQLDQAFADIERFPMMSEEVGRLLHETASYLRDRANYTEAEPLYLRALRIREQQLGPEHPDVAQTLNGLARLYYDQGRYREAEPLYQRALAIQEQRLGAARPDVALVLSNLAALYQDQGKYAEVEPLYLRALRIYEQYLGREHPTVAYALSNLAALYRELGRYVEAEQHLRRALQICEQRVGPENHGVAYPLSELAALYMAKITRCFHMEYRNGRPVFSSPSVFSGVRQEQLVEPEQKSFPYVERNRCKEPIRGVNEVERSSQAYTHCS